MGGGEPSDEPDDDLSDAEIRWFVKLVDESVPGPLTASSFEAAVSTPLLGLDVDTGRTAREQIFAALPDRRRLEVLGDVLTLAAVLRPTRIGGDCRCCGQRFAPLRFVDEDRICPDCWSFPVLDRPEGDAQGGGA